MKPSQKIRDFIMKEEGFRDTAYKPLPTDRYTYGYGSTYRLDGSAVEVGDYIAQEDAKTLFNSKLDSLAYNLSKFTNPTCTQQEFDATLSLCYNIGLHAFETSQTGLLYMNGRSISDRFLLWNKSGGKVIRGLVNRRMKEKRIYDEAIYS